MGMVKRYECLECKRVKKHIDMYSKDLCYSCWEKKGEELIQ